MAKTFIIFNICKKKDVLIDDLGICVPALKSIDLLSKSYNLSMEDIKKSYETGSIHKKKTFLFYQKVPTVFEKEEMVVSQQSLPSTFKGPKVEKVGYTFDEPEEELEEI
jgi:hypothetical protein